MADPGCPRSCVGHALSYLPLDSGGLERAATQVQNGAYSAKMAHIAQIGAFWGYLGVKHL